jgi:glucose-6-phosphate 1-dehydrogenase
VARPDQLVIFGASGDLTTRKLLPALVRNHRDEAFQRPVQVVGVSRSDRSHDAFRAEIAEHMPEELRDAWETFADQVFWVRADAADRAELAALEARLDDLLEAKGGHRRRSGRLFYLALAPALFGPVVSALAHQGMLECAPGGDEGWRRVVIEKPFGTDLASARALNRALLTHLREDQIFRIDHYLGKETVQNLIALRFQNAIFEPLWNRKHVESVEISVCEQVAMEGRRGAYYDTAGALRDMVQNHLMQVLTLVAMEAPASMGADDVRNEKVKVVRSLRLFEPEEVLSHTVRAQYVAGPEQPEGYLDAYGVQEGSTTETYVAIRALVDNWRWSGVPFLLRTGKALHQRFTEVVLRFRTPPLDLLHGRGPADLCALRPNTLRLLIQPEEGVRLSFLVKQPGQGMVMRFAELGFDYSELEHGASPPAYQRLLLDALAGNATLFLRGDEVEAAWRFVDTIREGWAATDAPVATYEAGSTGPTEADDLFHGCEGSWTHGPA